MSEQLRRLARLDVAVQVAEVPGAPGGLGWRTRVRFAVDGAGRVGLHRHRSHELQLIDRCLIASPGVEALGVERHAWPGVAHLEVFASEPNSGRVVSISTRSRRRRDRLPPVDAGLVVNRRTLRGPQRLHFEVLDRRFEVSAGVFWQVHPGAATVLARAVLDGLRPQRGEHVADLYAGAGLFAALAGDRVGPNGSVLAVERDRHACADAIRNTADQPHVTVRHAAVTEALVAECLGAADLVIVDPSRSGAGREVMTALASLEPGPRGIAYVACDAAVSRAIFACCSMPVGRWRASRVSTCSR